MRLEKIKLVGFKSFVDPTVIPIPGNMTAIVGPNGCGKSNTIDAVRWVLGESSAKELRGESMADVVFNGSSSRKPVAQASVELFFDNSDKSLSGNYASYAKIAVKRMVNREGESSYYFNNTRCRRKDIVDIFLGTGLGPRSYSIIQQGTISRLIEAKPEELRLFLEEAAGISKYKERRRETENRIKHTRENLERLQDIRDELGKQLERLDRQSKSAVKYKEYRQEERLLKAQLLTLRYTVLSDQLTRQESHIKELELQLESFIAEIRQLESQSMQFKEAHIEKVEAFNTVQSRFYGLGNDIARLEEAIRHQKDKKQQLENDLSQVKLELTQTETLFEKDKSSLSELKEALEALIPERDEAKAIVESSQEAVQQVETRRLAWQQTWDEFNATAAESSKLAHVEQARISQLEKRLESLSTRINQLTEQGSAQEISPLAQEIKMLEEQQTEVLAQIESEQEQLTILVESIQTLRNQISQMNTALAQERSTLQQARGRHASLEALQQAALGKSDSAAGAWLTKQGLQSNPRLAESLSVTPAWQGAVETVLGDYLQAICVDKLSDAVGDIATVSQGRVSIVEMQASSQTLTVPAGSLAEQVKTKVARVQAILADIFIADDIASAFIFAEKLAPHQSVITPDGIWLGKDWVRISKEEDARRGILQREQALQSSAEAIKKQAETLTQMEAQLATMQSDLAESEKGRDKQQQIIHETNKQKALIAADIQLKQGQVIQAEKRAREIASELASQEEQLKICQQEIHQARETWQQAMSAMDTQSSQRETLIQERDAISTSWSTLREALQSARDKAHQLDLHCQSTTSQVAALEASASRLQTQLTALASRKEGLSLALVKEETPDINLDAQLNDKLVQHQQVEQALKAAREACELVETKLKESDDRRSAIDQQARAVQSRLGQLRIDRENIVVRTATIEEQMAETEYQLAEIKENLPPELTEQQCEQRLQQLSQSIQRLGPINLAAIDEYQVELERKTYLDAQHQDLIEALETLENAIRKIDKETRTRFKETYDQVDNKFQELFPRLFGGGKAYLELTGEDLLDTGVTVMARPPGKRNSSIHSLSGGEKAMTAVALVFAIFHLNPSPFCMLDEVDAPLDDANVSRFCNMVKEMSAQTQFIFITHNKVTMEAATHLAGVTMHEPGVSRIVAVNIDEAVSLAEA